MFILIITAFMTTAANDHRTYQFSQLQEDHYIIINDGVMGGRSQSQIQLSADAAVYSGRVSLENNGGFASVRMLWPTTLRDSQEQARRLRLRVRGDGLSYQFRLRTDRGFDGAAYSHTFKTTAGLLQTIELTIADFTPTFRGRILTNMPELSFSDVQQMGILVADKQVGVFGIELIDLTWVD